MSLAQGKSKINFTCKPRILLIDDEEILLETMYDILMMEDCYIVDRESSVKAAKQRLLNNNYQLIITDVIMPGDTGLDLYRWILENKPESAGRIVFTSGDPYDPEVNKFMIQTNNLLLIKPFEMNEFINTVQQHVNNPA